MNMTFEVAASSSAHARSSCAPACRGTAAAAAPALEEVWLRRHSARMEEDASSLGWTFRCCDARTRKNRLRAVSPTRKKTGRSVPAFFISPRRAWWRGCLFRPRDATRMATGAGGDEVDCATPFQPAPAGVAGERARRNSIAQSTDLEDPEKRLQYAADHVSHPIRALAVRIRGTAKLTPHTSQPSRVVWSAAAPSAATAL